MNKLTDRFNRRHEYLRISVTDRCNLRCRYCMPPEGIELKPRAELLTFREIVTLAGIFVELGIKKIRITGGEPLVRNGIERLCAELKSLPGLETLALTTNGTQLKEKVSSLRCVGVSQLNISLDSLREGRFQEITLRSDLGDVLTGIDAALALGFESVKINMVVMAGVNDDEVYDFVEMAIAKSLNVRFVEYMPFLGNGWSEAQCLPSQVVKRRIEEHYHLTPIHAVRDMNGPSKDFSVTGTSAVVGFISTMSEHFCATCNRLRLTADGKLRNCLFAQEEFDLKRLLRKGAGRDVLEATIRAGAVLKWERHPDAEVLLAQQSRPMTGIGG